MVALAPHVELLEETSKSVEVDVTVTEPGAPVKLAPERFADCEALVAPTAVLENEVKAAIVREGDALVHSATGEVLLRGTGAVTTSKSLLLLSVSVQPLVFRTAPCVLTNAVPLFTVVFPSPLLEAP